MSFYDYRAVARAARVLQTQAHNDGEPPLELADAIHLSLANEIENLTANDGELRLNQEVQSILEYANDTLRGDLTSPTITAADQLREHVSDVIHDTLWGSIEMERTPAEEHAFSLSGMIGTGEGFSLMARVYPPTEQSVRSQRDRLEDDLRLFFLLWLDAHADMGLSERFMNHSDITFFVGGMEVLVKLTYE